MMQECFIIIIIIMGIRVSVLSSVLWRGFEPWNSFSGARDYARSAVVRWTGLMCKFFFAKMLSRYVLGLRVVTATHE